jgi:sulfotransferase family protein
VLKLQPRTLWRLRQLTSPVRPALVWTRHIGLTNDDLILAAYPKSGGTWLTFMLVELLSGRELSFEEQAAWAPAVGSHRRAPRIIPSGGRLIRSHEKYRPDYGRAIYLVRHAADVLVSYHRWLVDWIGAGDIPLPRFVDMFIDGGLDHYGPWHVHANSWLRASDTGSSQVHFARYEDLRNDTATTLEHIMSFLGADASDHAIQQAVSHNALQPMRAKQEAARETVFRRRGPGSLVRTGSVGDSERVLSADQLRRIASACGDTLQRFGYPPLAPSGSA